MRGRRPVPTALRVLRGNPGRRPLNQREPKPRLGLPPCPSSLKGPHRAAWRQITKMLRDAGIGTALDRHAMMLLVDAWVMWETATTALRQSGLLIRAPSGYPMMNPLVAIVNKAHDQLVRLLAEFGMTPSSRTRIETWTPEPSGGLEDLLSGP